MNMKGLAQKYGLTRADFWEMKRGGRSIWIVTHDACEKIAAIEDVKILSPTWLAKGQGEHELWALEVRGYVGNRPEHDDEMIWTTGEADMRNCKLKPPYLVAMAEKRGRDRLILKIIKTNFDISIYSESEADSFKRPQGGDQ